MTAARPVAAATSTRLGRVHTNRIPEPVWATLGVQALYEDRRDGRGEIIREVLEDHVRSQLAAAGFKLGAREPLTMEIVEEYCRTLLGESLAGADLL